MKSLIFPSNEYVETEKLGRGAYVYLPDGKFLEAEEVENKKERRLMRSIILLTNNGNRKLFLVNAYADCKEVVFRAAGSSGLIPKDSTELKCKVHFEIFETYARGSIYTRFEDFITDDELPKGMTEHTYAVFLKNKGEKIAIYSLKKKLKIQDIQGDAYNYPFFVEKV